MNQLNIKKYYEDDSVKLLFLGAVHGNEKCGSRAIVRVIDMLDNGEISLNKGSVTFIPICNPEAYEQNTREINLNLNRIIQITENPSTYEEVIANQVAGEIKETDYLVDLHSSYTDDAPFAFLDYDNEGNRKLIQASSASYVLSGFPDVYNNADVVQMSTETFANELSGACGITVECGNHYKEESEDFALQVILNTLKSFDMIGGDFNNVTTPEYLGTKEVVFKSQSGAMSHDYQNFDEIKQGEILAVYDDGEEIVSEYDGVIILPNKDAKVGHEWFYIGKGENHGE